MRYFHFFINVPCFKNPNCMIIFVMQVNIN